LTQTNLCITFVWLMNAISHSNQFGLPNRSEMTLQQIFLTQELNWGLLH